MRSDYAPDRTAALLEISFTVGLTLIGLLGLGRYIGDPRYTPWFQTYWTDIGYQTMSVVYGIWLCIGVYRGRRWALIGKALDSLWVAVWTLYFGWSPYVIVPVAMLGYCLLRLTAKLGPLPANAPLPPIYLPDRLTGVGFAILNVYTVLGTFAKHEASDRELGSMSFTWMAVTLVQVFWFNFGLYQSRG